MRNRYQFADFLITGAVACLLLISCNSELEEQIDWKLEDHADMLVVEGVITNLSKKQIVYLTKTSPYFENGIPSPVSNAIVTVGDGTHTFTYSESESEAGKYISDSSYSGIPFTAYSIHILLASPLNDISEFSAQTKMPDGLNLDSIKCEIYPMPDLGFEAGVEDQDTTLLGIYYYGKEPDNPDNYYFTVLTVNGHQQNRNAKDYIRFTDDQNNGSESDFILFIQNLSNGDTVGFEVNSIEESFYNYIGSIQQMDQSGSAYSMSGPPANAEGNIPGALGYFNAVYISEKQAIAKRN